MPDILREENRIQILSLNKAGVISDLASAIRDVLTAGYTEVEVGLASVTTAFPSPCAPVAAMMGYLVDAGINVKYLDTPENPMLVSFEHPLAPPKTEAWLGTTMSRLWAFSDEADTYFLLRQFIGELQRSVECGPGVLQGIEWSLTEVMDNVLVHSQAKRGYVMMQLQRRNKYLAICVADLGVGIFGTLSASQYHPASDLDAITLAIKPGVTRNKSIGQGNGLWGLAQIVDHNEGRLEIQSGDAALLIQKDGNKSYKELDYVSEEHKGTFVNFQLDYHRAIDLQDALEISPINIRLEQHELDTGNHTVAVREISHGTGTRRAGEKLRNYVSNMVSEGANRITIDFSGVGLVSSSFADEFIGKLVTRYGFVSFNQLFQIANMTHLTEAIVHKSVAQRMLESVNGDKEQQSD